MDLASKKTVKAILKKYNIKPSKKFGQNFLIDKSVVKKVIKTAELKPLDTVLEIGPGIGTLTQEIAARAGKVIAVEKDHKMCEILRETLKDFKNVKVIQGDILKFNKFLKNYKIVANLPFYLTAPVIRKFLEAVDVRHRQPRQMVLVVQKEVGQRICPPNPIRNQKISNGARMNLLAVSVQFYAQAKIIDYISKKSFWPEPKVDAAIIKIVSRNFRVPISREFRDQFFRIVKAGFSHPRKQILNNFTPHHFLWKSGGGLNKAKIKQWLIQNNIQPSQRAETLSIADWLNLTKSCKNF